ncbi:MAG: Xaa-Pro peptidase family protein [Alsobacter sp.]
MSKHDFSAAEFAERRSRLQAAMQEAGLDWLVAIHPVSIHWLTGSDAKSYQEFQCLLVGAKGEPLVVLTRAGETHEFETDSLADEVVGWGGGIVEDPIAAFEALATRLGLRTGRVGLEVPGYYLHPHHYVRLRAWLSDALAGEATDLISRLRLVRSPAELGFIREATAYVDVGMERFLAALRPGVSELALAGSVYEAIMAAGSGIAASPMNLVSGERSAYSHGAPTQRILRAGDYGSIEYGATCRRYTATIGRQFVLGRPTRRMLELYDVVRRASDAMIAAIADGVPAEVPHEAARAVIVEAGLEEYRVHTSGYAVGPGFPPSWGEPLHMMGGVRDILRSGMVLTVEPPVFVGPEGLGARIIDNVLVTPGGAEILSSTSRDLIVVD